MDLLAGQAESQNGQRPDSPNMLAIKDAFRATMNEGFEAGLEFLLRCAREDCEFRPYIATTGVVRGHEAIRAYYRDALDSGTEMKLRATSFHELDDQVVVNGTVRVARAGGGFSESQISWTYRFRDGLLAEAAWGPRQAL